MLTVVLAHPHTHSVDPSCTHVQYATAALSEKIPAVVFWLRLEALLYYSHITDPEMLLVVQDDLASARKYDFSQTLEDACHKTYQQLRLDTPVITHNIVYMAQYV